MSLSVGHLKVCLHSPNVILILWSSSNHTMQKNMSNCSILANEKDVGPDCAHTQQLTVGTKLFPFLKILSLTWHCVVESAGGKICLTSLQAGVLCSHFYQSLKAEDILKCFQNQFYILSVPIYSKFNNTFEL